MIYFSTCASVWTMKTSFHFQTFITTIVAGFLAAAFFCQLVATIPAFADDESSDQPPATTPELYIKAINPGYSLDGKSDVGEMIEIAVTAPNSSDTMISLAGLTIRYITSSGSKSYNLVEFPEHSYLTGESIILRLASSPDHELASLTYTKTLALEGRLELYRSDEVIDSVCWIGNGKAPCYHKFESGSPTTLVRESFSDAFTHLTSYAPVFSESSYTIIGTTDPDPSDGLGGGDSDVISQCGGVTVSEILSYYAESQSEQFIELYNSNSEQVLLDGCSIRYKNKLYPLTGILKPDAYQARYLTDFSITKNPTNINTIEILDTNSTVVDKVEYPNGQLKGTSWALIGYDDKGEKLWRTTYAVTPGAPNIYQEFRTCESGKVINEATGNCVKVTEATVKTCAEGQYLNPLTGRCKKLPTATSTTTECKEGYILNEATGRCKKIKENTGASYALATETYEESSSFVALYAVIGVVVAGLAYAVYEFRHEIKKLAHKVFRRSR